MPVRLDMRDYDFLDDAYTGGGGFVNGGYLIRHAREQDDKYYNRQELSYYSNFVKPVVDSLTNPIFRKMIARDWRGKHRFLNEFLDNVDRKGSTMNRFMKNAARWARLYGSVFIMVDNGRDIKPSISDARAARNFPYVYFVKPRQIEEFRTDSFGMLEYVRYNMLPRLEYYGQAGASNVPDEVWEWTPTSWKVTHGDGKSETGVNYLNFIPMVALLGTDADICDIMPISPVMSIARTNLAIFNRCSELSELLRNQAFSILCYPITEQVSLQQVKDGINIGTDNMLAYDGSAKGPFFISPDASQAKLLQEEIQRLIEDIYRQASLASIVGVQTRTSGVARQWDFEQTNQSLCDMAENCEIAEREIVRCFLTYMGEDEKNSQYKVIYPRDFGIVDVAADLDKVTQALSLNVGAEFNRQAKKKAVEAYLSNIPNDEYDKVIDDINRQSDDELYHGIEDELGRAADDYQRPPSTANSQPRDRLSGQFK